MGKVSKIFKKSKSPILMKNHQAVSVSSYLSPLSRFLDFVLPLCTQFTVLKEILYKMEISKNFWNFFRPQKMYFFGNVFLSGFSSSEVHSNFFNTIFHVLFDIFQNSNSLTKSCTNGNFNIFWIFFRSQKIYFFGECFPEWFLVIFPWKVIPKTEKFIRKS